MKRFLFVFILLAILISGFTSGIYYLHADKQFSVAKFSVAKLMQTINQNSGLVDSGRQVYLGHCLLCHQKDGSGVPGMYPPLKQSDWVNGDKIRLIKILLDGLEGEIEVNGETYINSMPKQNYLTDKQIAEVLSFVRKNFENNADKVNTNEVASLRHK